MVTCLYNVRLSRLHKAPAALDGTNCTAFKRDGPGPTTLDPKPDLFHLKRCSLTQSLPEHGPRTPPESVAQQTFDSITTFIGDASGT